MKKQNRTTFPCAALKPISASPRTCMQSHFGIPATQPSRQSSSAAPTIALAFGIPPELPVIRARFPPNAPLNPSAQGVLLSASPFATGSWPQARSSEHTLLLIEQLASLYG